MSNNLFLEQIRKNIENKEYMEIYSYSGNGNEFAVGQIVAYSSEDLLIHAINNMGMDDGFFIGKIKDICKISRNTKYLQDINKLSGFHDYPILQIPDDIANLNLFDYFIDFFICHETIVTIHTYYQDVIHGIIVNYINDILKIKVYTNDCYENGESIILAYDIETISFNGIEEKRMEKLKGLL